MAERTDPGRDPASGRKDRAEWYKSHHSAVRRTGTPGVLYFHRSDPHDFRLFEHTLRGAGIYRYRGAGHHPS